MPRRHLLILLCFVVSCSSMACAPKRVGLSAARPFQFVAYGDMPYGVAMPDGRSDAQVLADDIAPEIRRREDLPFVIHVGDLGRPEDVCTDVQLESYKIFWATALVVNRCSIRLGITTGPIAIDRRSLCPLRNWRGLRRCGGFSSAHLQFSPPLGTMSHNPLSRKTRSGGMRVCCLSLYIWLAPITAGAEILLDDPGQAIALANARDEANRLWLDHAFTLATQREAAAVVIATQVDPFGPPQGNVDAFSRCLNRPAYAAFCEQILHLSATLGKPVLLIHGDTNAYCLDQPFPIDQAPRLWRLNAPGDFDVIDAAVVSINPARSSSPFAVTGLLSGQAAPQECNYRRR